MLLEDPMSRIRCGLPVILRVGRLVGRSIVVVMRRLLRQDCFESEVALWEGA